MVQSNELRIGNWVEANSPAMIVKAIYNDGVELYMPGSEADNFSNYSNELFPIPLSAEILEKAGFEKSSYAYYLNRIFFIEPVDNEWVFGEKYQGAYTKIKYLHQLQNLYFSLTGEELPVKL